MNYIEINKVLAIIIGILSFLCFSISYAILSFHSCPIIMKMVSWGISICLCVLFLKFCIQTKSDVALLDLVKNIISSIIIVLICGWLILLCLVYLFRYCGSSTGTQNSEKLFSDAATIYDYFANRDDINKNNIVVISHSLGTGIAIHLALKRDIKGIILSCPYDKYVTGVIQEKLPLVPIKLLIKEEYNSISIAPKLNKPVLFLLAEEDKTVVRGRSMKLFDHWGSKNRKISIINNTNHESITIHDLTWSNINTFLDNFQ